MKRAIMIQGSASGVGKSMIAMAIIRHFSKKGVKVAPFKAQNMSLNSAVSCEGGEMSRAQYVQAIAAGAIPSVEMNPILIKPQAGSAQLIVKGKPFGQIDSNYYMNSRKTLLWKIITESLDNLMRDNDLVVIEGAGSPVEINLKSGDIVNMRVAKAAGASVILVADIDRGGAFAQVTGTMMLLERAEKKLVSGFLFNKFRGNLTLLGDYPQKIATSLGIDYFGTVPYIDHRIAEEDSFIADRCSRNDKADIKIAVIDLPHIANLDDFDPLLDNCNVEFVRSGKIEADIIIIPGTKDTIDDLDWLIKSSLAEKILEANKKGMTIFGICGGYQMLGVRITDESGREADGLGLLPVKTIFRSDKKRANLSGIINLDGIKADVKGYEIHHGITEPIGNIKPFIRVTEKNGESVGYFDGAYCKNVYGTYFHSIFQNADFTERFLNNLRKQAGFKPKNFYWQPIDKQIERFCKLFEKSVNIKKIDRLAGL